MTKPAQATPEASGATPAPPTVLRAIAAWLESHPAANVDDITLIGIGRRPVRAHDYSHHSPEAVFEATFAVEPAGPWRLDQKTPQRDGVGRASTEAALEIAPGVEYRIVHYEAEGVEL